MMSCISRLIARVLLVFSLLILISCSDDDPMEPAFQFQATLESLWPHADGNSWSYRLTTEECQHAESVFYDNLEDVPPVPPIEDLYARLADGFPCDAADIESGTLNLSFDGEVEFFPGELFQRIRSLVEADEGWPNAPRPLAGRLWHVSEDRIVAYPDWKNDDWISWVYLTVDLEPGSEFSYQLSPAFGSDVFLHGRIWRHVRHSLPDRSVVNCVECFYLLDLGILEATDESGQFLRYARAYEYGTVLYADGIGPIQCREHRDGPSKEVLQDPLPANRYTVATEAYLTDWSVQGE